MWKRSVGMSLPKHVMIAGTAAVLLLTICVSRIPSWYSSTDELLAKTRGVKNMDKWEDTYFHPLPAGVKLDQKIRTRLYSSQHNKPSAISKKWESFENGYFQPLGKGAKLSNTERYNLYADHKKSLQKGASKWQNWEDHMFGHTMQAVASRRMPAVVAGAAKAGHKKHESLVDALASHSWVSEAEVGGSVPHKKLQRFVDSIA